MNPKFKSIFIDLVCYHDPTFNLIQKGALSTFSL